MMQCPQCRWRRRLDADKHELLKHIWFKHLNGHTDPEFGRRRECWCGTRHYQFFSWMDHIWSLDVQAHYAAALLGISR